MMVPRLPSTRSSVARLLADLPRERLVVLAESWKVADPGGGWIAAIYRQMTDPRMRREVVARLPDAVQLVFTTLAAARRPLTRDEILRSLPFSEEDVERSLATLDGCGLVWRDTPAGRESTYANRRWFVPLELCEKDPPKRSAARPSRLADGVRSAAPPELEAAAAIPATIRPFGIVPRAISVLDDLVTHRAPLPPGLTADALAYARHCGTALGVWTRTSRGLEAGLRAEDWRRLGLAEQIRAVARLWLVDERAPRRSPEQVRRALWEALRLSDPAVWYDLNSLARRVAWLASVAGGRTSEDRPVPPREPGTGISRRDLESAVEVLGWIGLAAVGDDGTGRPVAICLGKHGPSALA